MSCYVCVDSDINGDNAGTDVKLDHLEQRCVCYGLSTEFMRGGDSCKSQNCMQQTPTTVTSVSTAL